MPNKYKIKNLSLFAILNKFLEIKTHKDVAGSDGEKIRYRCDVYLPSTCFGKKKDITFRNYPKKEIIV